MISRAYKYLTHEHACMHAVRIPGTHVPCTGSIMHMSFHGHSAGLDGHGHGAREYRRPAAGRRVIFCKLTSTISAAGAHVHVKCCPRANPNVITKT